MHLDLETLGPLARGCAILGSGGGGSVALGQLIAAEALKEHGPVQLLHPDHLAPETAVLTVSLAGSPGVSAERLGSADEALILRERVEAVNGQRAGAVLCAEVGGLNGCLAAAYAARLGLPLLDADAVGRAFPRIDQNVLELAGVSAVPAVITDEYGHSAVIDHVDGALLDVMIHSIIDSLGGRALVSDYPVTAGTVARSAIPGSISRALRLGAPDGLPQPLLSGRIAEVKPSADGGSVLIEGLGADSGRLVQVLWKTEFLAVIEEGEVLALVPDIIVVEGARSREALTTVETHRGALVHLHALLAAPQWYTTEAFALAGPEPFGLGGLPRPATFSFRGRP